MPISQRRLRPALFYLLLTSLVIGLSAQWVVAAEIDVVGLFSYFQWETGPSVNACPLGAYNWCSVRPPKRLKPRCWPGTDPVPASAT